MASGELDRAVANLTARACRRTTISVAIFSFRIGLLAGLMISMGGCRFGQSGNESAAREPDHRPSVILIMADDLDCEMLFDAFDPAAESDYPFPAIQRLMREGVTLTNLHATTPVCGPSRACLLSGQYAHRNGVRVNQPATDLANGFPGGYRSFDPRSEFSLSLRRAQYQTCFFGKYIHEGFVPQAMAGESWATLRPPGWEVFEPSLGAKYFDFPVVDNATCRVKSIEREHRVDWEADRVCRQLSGWKSGSAAQFICWLPVAPHEDMFGTRNVAERHRQLFSDSEPPSLSRQTGSLGLDLPRELDGLPSTLSASMRESIRNVWRNRLRATKALDEGIARIFDTLESQERIDNTILILVSDHGFRLGDQGHVGKRLPADAITRVPAIAWGCGIAAGQSNDEVLALIDLAPTVLELCDVDEGSEAPPRDGRSFASILRQPDAPWVPERRGVLLENWEQETSFGQRYAAVWTAWRERHSLYTEWAGGGRELYDLHEDPHQQNNRYASLGSEERQRLEQTLRQSHGSLSEALIGELSITDNIYEGTTSFLFRPLVLRGYVEAHQGVADVTITIASAGNDEYWNGQGWTTERVQLPVELGSPGSLISEWRYTLIVPPENRHRVAEREEANVQVHVHVTDGKGRKHEGTNRLNFVARFQEPETWIDCPSDVTTGCRPGLITGTAEDLNGVASVKVMFHDKQRDLFWDGQAWIDEYTRVDAEVIPDPDSRRVRWRYDFTGNSDGPVFVGARALGPGRTYDFSIAGFDWPAREPVAAE